MQKKQRAFDSDQEDSSRRFGVCQKCEGLSTVDKTKKSKLEHHMAELIKIIDEAGVAIVINLDYVVQMQPTERENMTAITIADGTSKYAINASGAPEQIAMAQRIVAGQW
jgi:hypothetical protein